MREREREGPGGDRRRDIQRQTHRDKRAETVENPREENKLKWVSAFLYYDEECCGVFTCTTVVFAMDVGIDRSEGVNKVAKHLIMNLQTIMTGLFVLCTQNSCAVINKYSLSIYLHLLQYTLKYSSKSKPNKVVTWLPFLFFFSTVGVLGQLIRDSVNLLP